MKISLHFLSFFVILFSLYFLLFSGQNENINILTITNKAFIEDTIDKSFTRRQESIAYFKEASEKLEAYESRNKALLQEIHELKTRNQGLNFTNCLSQPPLFKAIVVSTLAGSTKGCADGNGTMAKMNRPRGVVFNPVDDCLYVCDYYNSSIRKVTKEGQVSTFVYMNWPVDITFSVKQQCFFVSELSSNLIKKVTMKGESSILAGGKGIGYQSGEGENAMFNWPSGIAVNEETGDVYVADKGNNVIRMITLEGKVTTLAGTAGNGGYSDGKSKSSLFNIPGGICFHSQYQALFVCDTGQVSTVCEIIRPESVCILSNNAMLVSSCNNQIFKVSFGENNKVETKVFAGSGERGYKDGPPQESQFNFPHGMAIDSTTNTCFVSDSGNHKIRTIKYQ